MVVSVVLFDSWLRRHNVCHCGHEYGVAAQAWCDRVEERNVTYVVVCTRAFLCIEGVGAVGLREGVLGRIGL